MPDVAPVAAPDDRQLIVGRIRLHYLDWGNNGAPAVILLHGGGLNARTWDAVCLALRSRYHCLALDLRGHGDSEWSPEVDYSLDAHLADLEGFVAQLGLPRLAVVGHSLGAFIGLRYAALNQQVLAGYVSVDASPFLRDDTAGRQIVKFILGRDEFLGLDDAVEYVRSFNPSSDPRLLRRSLATNLRRRPAGGLIWKHDLHRYLSPTGFEELVAQIRKLVPEARAVNCPTLVVRGSRSPALSPCEAAEFVGHLTAGRTVTVDHAGHNVQRDNPAGLVSELFSFLGGCAWTSPR
jgi:pimeloyl-ACP methyl ester carboxylesterase